MRRAIVVVAWLVSFATLTGCSPAATVAKGTGVADAVPGNAAAADPAAAPAFDEEVARARVDAVAGGASEQQLSLIDEISQQGSVSYEQAKGAAVRTVECIEDSGGSAEVMDLTQGEEFSVPSYSAAGGTGAEGTDLAAIDTCDRQESYWVNYLYQVQPDAVVSMAQEEALKLAARIDCLEEAGGTAPADPVWETVREAVDELPEPQRTQCIVASLE
ncbi:hypothetical protein [Demequina sediminicola]|uniref:hypothetical protein n=1 Tax=Demequina sediminicola TaxID=1095026 RepID=UPI000785B6FF|nr:hypothetical protein [Demequina sediminicola]